jgi:predicted acylesterase/phospholipase RssA/CRP-like cAMP-binding protein
VELSEKVQRLRRADVFAGLSAEALEETAGIAELTEVGVGDYLVREVDGSRDLFVIIEGRGVLVGTRLDADEEVVVGHVEAGDVVGDIQALTGGKLGASVRAETQLRALRLGWAEFEAVSARHTSILEALSADIRARHLRHALRSALKSRYYVKGDETLAEIEAAVEWRHLDRGEIVTRQGKASDGVYILLTGRLEAVRDRGDGTRRIAEILPGEAAGETSILRGEVSYATVSATRPSEVAAIPRQVFITLAHRYPGLARGLLEIMLWRVRPGNDQNIHPGQTVAFIPIGRDLPVTELVRQSARMTDQDVRSKVINRDTVRERFGSPDLSELDAREPISLRLTNWLEQVEGRHELVLYEVDRVDSPWARRCAGIAEEIALIARASDDPRPGPEERRLLDPSQWPVRPHITLVLVHESGGKPGGTRKWLEGRNVDTVLHVRLGEPTDIGRLARFVTRRAVGVVMSGGAARGWAAVGVLRALEEHKVPVDAVGGVSGGALISAMYANGFTPDGILEAVTDPAGIKQFAPGMPTVSLISGKRLDSFFRDKFGGIDIEDLWRPCFFVSTNLSQAQQVMSTRGDLVTSVLASNAMPPIFPPFRLGGDLCVDGAFVNNLPIAEMSSFVRGGPVVAIDVTPSVTGERLATTSRVPAKVREILQLDEPQVFETLMRCQLVHHVARMRTVQKLASLYLAPDVRQFGLLAHGSTKEIARAGYEQSTEEVKTWWSRHTENLKIARQARDLFQFLGFEV